MKKLKSMLRSLRVKTDSVSPTAYKKEALKILSSYNISDKNFKILFYEFIDKSKDNVDIATLRDVISMLQRHVCQRINEEDSSSEFSCVKNKTRLNKREWRR